MDPVSLPLISQPLEPGYIRTWEEGSISVFFEDSLDLYFKDLRTIQTSYFLWLLHWYHEAADRYFMTSLLENQEALWSSKTPRNLTSVSSPLCSIHLLLVEQLLLISNLDFTFSINGGYMIERGTEPSDEVTYDMVVFWNTTLIFLDLS